MTHSGHTSGRTLVDHFGVEVARAYDKALEEISLTLPGGNPELTKQWVQFLKPFSLRGDQDFKLAQLAMETLLHKLLFCLQEQTTFRLQALTAEGWTNLLDYSDGLHGELFVWLENESKHGSIVNELIAAR